MNTNLNERDEKLLQRHQAMCSECPGLDACKEQGMILQSALGPDDFVRVRMGPCQLRKRRIEERKTEKLFAQAQIPLGLQKCSLDNFVTTGRGESIMRAKFEAVNAIQTGCSLVLAGGIGTGKTHLAAAIVHRTILEGRSALFISAIAYLEQLKRKFTQKSKDKRGVSPC